MAKVGTGNGQVLAPVVKAVDESVRTAGRAQRDDRHDGRWLHRDAKQNTRWAAVVVWPQKVVWDRTGRNRENGVSPWSRCVTALTRWPVVAVRMKDFSARLKLRHK